MSRTPHTRGANLPSVPSVPLYAFQNGPKEHPPAKERPNVQCASKSGKITSIERGEDLKIRVVGSMSAISVMSIVNSTTLVLSNTVLRIVDAMWTQS